MKIFGFVKKMFFVGLAILSSLTNANSLSCTSMNNQECRVGPQFINVNGDEPVFFPFNFKTSKCNGSCNNINYPDAKICVPDVAKILNVKVFNLMSRTNETRYIEWHVTCKYECKFGENMHYTCIACITIDSIMRIDKKNHPQIYLEECKYRAKKMQMLRFINTELKSDFHKRDSHK